MVRGAPGRIPAASWAAAAALAAAAGGILWFGARGARAAGREAAGEARRALAVRLEGEAAAAAGTLRAVVEATRGGVFSGVPFPLETGAARFRPDPPAPADARPFAEAERLEVEAGDPTAARVAYAAAVAEDLPPALLAEGLRHLARLARTAGDAGAAAEALSRLRALEGAPDRELLLAAFAEAAREGGAAADRLAADIESGRYFGAAPAERVALHARLGGAPDGVAALAAAASLGDAEDPRSLVAAGPARAAWSLGPAGDEVRVALAPLDGILRALLPGAAEGLFERGGGGGAVRLPPPFPAGLDLRPSAAALAAAGTASAEATRRLLLPAAGGAAVLLAAAGGLLVLARGRARLEGRRDAFVCAVTHELKTPLANILLYAETLSAHGAADPARVAGFAGTIAGEALKLQARVQDVLDVASGRREVGGGPASFDPVAEVRAAVVEREPAAAARGMRIEVEGGADLPRAAGEPTLFRRALGAVVDNAVKFAGRGTVRVILGAEPGAVLVAVEDEGPGIPREARESVFEPFLRLGDERTRSVEGTGLGLALARRCLEVGGGTVIAAEPRGGGARFEMRLREAADADHPRR